MDEPIRPVLDAFRSSYGQMVLHSFCGRGAKDAIPLWRDSSGKSPNITAGVLRMVSTEHGEPLSAEQFFAYAYGILAQPGYTQRFWDELEVLPPRLPITKDPDLFAQVSKHGTRLIYLHTYAERFGGPDDDGKVPQGEARNTKAVSLDKYPAAFDYNPLTRILKVGDGEFYPVAPDVWEYSVSGLEVVRSWLNYRKREPSGRKSSPLDEVKPDSWVFSEELLELLWVLEATIALQPEGAALLEEVCNSDLFTAEELPTPTARERKPPGVPQPIADQPELDASFGD